MPRNGDPKASDILFIETKSHRLAVREMLDALMDGLVAWQISPENLHRIELVLAETLNNVFEHACAYEDGIYLAIKIELERPYLRVEVVDEGVAMPGLSLPKQALPNHIGPDVNVPRDAMPEGGWGWGLIRDLTDHIRYERHDNKNHLHLQLCV